MQHMDMMYMYMCTDTEHNIIIYMYVTTDNNFFFAL